MKRNLAWVVVFAVLLRSFIPVGYMPDFTPGQSFALVFCDGTDHSQHMGHMHHGAHSHGGVCPFAASAAVGLAGLHTPDLAAPAYVLAEAARAPAPAVPGRSAFGNASPRSPPRLSA